MTLETAYYTIGIICMSLITLIVLGLIIVAIFIAIKVHHIQKAIKSKVQPFADVVEHVTDAAKNAKKAFKK